MSRKLVPDSNLRKKPVFQSFDFQVLDPSGFPASRLSSQSHSTNMLTGFGNNKLVDKQLEIDTHPPSQISHWGRFSSSPPTKIELELCWSSCGPQLQSLTIIQFQGRRGWHMRYCAAFNGMKMHWILNRSDRHLGTHITRTITGKQDHPGRISSWFSQNINPTPRAYAYCITTGMSSLSALWLNSIQS